MSYSIIYDRKQVEEFETLFFSTSPTSPTSPKFHTKEEQIFLLFLSARKKYCPDIVNTGCFKRVIVKYKNNEKNSVRKLFNVLKQYEIPLNYYFDKNNNSIPQESLVAYASLNPRNAIHATQELSKDILDKAFSHDTHFFSTIDQKFKNNLQKHPIKQFVGIDLDTKDETIYNQLVNDLLSIINIFSIIETKGGYHIIIDKNNINNINGQIIYKKLKEKYKDIDQISNDLFSPIPGTLQGGFQVKFKDVYSTEASILQ